MNEKAVNDDSLPNRNVSSNFYTGKYLLLDSQADRVYQTVFAVKMLSSPVSDRDSGSLQPQKRVRFPELHSDLFQTFRFRTTASITEQTNAARQRTRTPMFQRQQHKSYKKSGPHKENQDENQEKDNDRINKSFS